MLVEAAELDQLPAEPEVLEVAEMEQQQPVLLEPQTLVAVVVVVEEQRQLVETVDLEL